MKKILLLTTDFAPSKGGGICTHSNFLVEHLSKHGWSFVIFSEYYIPTPEQTIEAFAKSYKFPVYHVPDALTFKDLIKKIFYLIKLFRKHKPDIIIGSGRHPVWFAAILSTFFRKPLITIGHGTEFTQQTSEKDFKYNKWAYGKSDLIIAISQFTKNIISRCGLNKNNVTIITNAADENFFKILPQETINDFKTQKGIQICKVIVSVGTFSDRKGQKIILEALPHVIKEQANVIYVSIGMTPLDNSHIHKVNELGISNNVYFAGCITNEELLLWLNAADIFLMTSTNANGDYEGYGIAVVEAALCGKPAIVSDNGGLKEAVIDNQTGLIVPEKDPLKTAIAINKLLNDTPLLKELGNNAYQNAIENNTLKVKSAQYHNELIKFIKK